MCSFSSLHALYKMVKNKLLTMLHGFLFPIWKTFYLSIFLFFEQSEFEFNLPKIEFNIINRFVLSCAVPCRAVLCWCEMCMICWKNPLLLMHKHLKYNMGLPPYLHIVLFFIYIGISYPSGKRKTNTNTKFRMQRTKKKNRNRSQFDIRHYNLLTSCWSI